MHGRRVAAVCLGVCLLAAVTARATTWSTRAAAYDQTAIWRLQPIHAAPPIRPIVLRALPLALDRSGDTRYVALGVCRSVASAAAL